MEFLGSKTLVMMQSDRLEFDPYFFGEGCDSIADEAIKAIVGAARTGEIGDGRVFVLPALESYRIRTGEKES